MKSHIYSDTLNFVKSTQFETISKEGETDDIFRKRISKRTKIVLDGNFVEQVSYFADYIDTRFSSKGLRLYDVMVIRQ